MRRSRRLLLLLAGLVAAGSLPEPTPAGAAVSREEVEQAIAGAVRFLKSLQNRDGSWDDADGRAPVGTSALVTLALLTAGEGPEDPAVARALAHLERFDANQLGTTYAVGLQTMVFSHVAQLEPGKYKVELLNNVQWLERAQIRPGDRFRWPGSWTYHDTKRGDGDNSNSQYALLGLYAASEAGISVKPEVWAMARQYWEIAQRQNGPDRGAWGYFPNDMQPASGSMTCAGIASLVICGSRRFQGSEILVGDRIRNCGEGGFDPVLQGGIDWLSAHFRVGENYGKGQTWKYYYLYGLERTGRLSGLRFFGNHDWYFEGAEELVHEQDRLQGKWTGSSMAESNPLIATSFALLFLAKGRSPVLINKLRHGPGNDWNNDRDDIRNLTNLISRDWKHLLTFQVVDPESATIEELMQAPILFFNGHKPPEFGPQGLANLRQFVEQGGLIFAEACCSKAEFDVGFRALMKQVFPEPEYELQPLSPSHAVWRARHILTPDVHPLWGIDYGCRTVVIYSPEDLSCYWNQLEVQPDNPAVIKAIRVGQNVIDYATGRELPPDKLAQRTVTEFEMEQPKRGALHIAKLRHGGEWNVAPLAIPNLTTFLRQSALKFDVVINHREFTTPRDPNLVYYPLVYLHGRAAFTFQQEDLEAIRQHLNPGGGMIFADAACGSEAFDTAFRRFAAQLYPDQPLEPIPPDDELYTARSGFDLSDVEFTKGAGGGRGRPQLEGVKLDGHWAIIYSKYDIGCALERQASLECKGYTHESALRIASNVVIYSTLP